MSNENTSHLSLPLPHPDNLLEADVERLREALTLLDAHAGNVLDALTHKADASGMESALSQLTALLGQKATTLELNAHAALAGSTAAAGHLKLVNATNSTSTTDAATANAAKQGYDKALEAYDKALAAMTAIPVAFDGTPSDLGESAESGVLDEYARADHKHPKQTYVESSQKAEALVTARTISIPANLLGTHGSAKVSFSGAGDVAFASNCNGNCTGTCSGNCVGGCTSCTGTCVGGCTSCTSCSSCSGSCAGSCTANCANTCSSMCTGYCIGYCAGPSN